MEKITAQEISNIVDLVNGMEYNERLQTISNILTKFYNSKYAVDDYEDEAVDKYLKKKNNESMMCY